MPSLKQSTTQKCTYGGLQGKQLFYDAINFLFAIKGKEFAKSNPSFLTPSVDEFISFSRHSERVVHATAKKPAKYKPLQQFLHFISGGFVFENEVLRSIYITMFALATYNVTDYFLMGADSVSEDWIAAFLWYTSHTFSFHTMNHDVISGAVNRYMRSMYFDHIDTLIKNYHSDETDALAVGRYVVHSLESHNSMRSYDIIVQIPIVATWCKKASGGVYTPWIMDKIAMYGLT